MDFIGKSYLWKPKILLILLALFVVGYFFITTFSSETYNSDPMFYYANITNTSFKWTGPTSRQDKIPVNHAVRGLSYLGDVSAPYLFKAINDPTISDYIIISSVMVALKELGMPTENYRDDLLARKTESIEAWWYTNFKATAKNRSAFRERIGLPRVDSQLDEGHFRTHAF